MQMAGYRYYQNQGRQLFITVKMEKRQQTVDIREAFNLWDVLNSKYMAVERLQTWHSIAHDYDLKLIISQTVKVLSENIKILEKLALQGACILHAQSYKECVISDRVRNLLKQFL